MPDEISFDSQGVRCSAWLLPAESDELSTARGRPCVVMGHGFGATKDAGLLPFAERFAAAGAHVLVFDYRGYGTSAAGDHGADVPQRDVRAGHPFHRAQPPGAICPQAPLPDPGGDRQKRHHRAPAAVRAVERKATRAEAINFDCGHFDIYTGEIFEKSVAAQVDFLGRTVSPRAMSGVQRW